MLDYLPEEILVDVFKRLPIKTLLLCTSVSKSWNTLITHPKFITAHLNRTASYNNNHDLLLVRNYLKAQKEEHYSLRIDNEEFCEYQNLELPFKSYELFFRIIGSSNGVVCLTDDAQTYIHNTILWNPSILKYVTLPRPRVTFMTHGSFEHVLGFGYDLKSNDYKVVRIVYCLNDPESVLPAKVDLYTLSTATWCNISHLGLCYWIAERGSQVFMNGASHWMAADSHWTKKPYNERQKFIAWFHMGDEVFGHIMLPAEANDWYDAFTIRLTIFDGSLSLIDCDSEESWCIWVMKEYGVAESWSKQFIISVGPSMDWLVGVRKNAELFILEGGQLVSYDTKAAVRKGLGIKGKVGSWRAFDIMGYVESLGLLGSRVHGEQNRVERTEKKSKRKCKQKRLRRGLRLGWMIKLWNKRQVKVVTRHKDCAGVKNKVEKGRQG